MLAGKSSVCALALPAGCMLLLQSAGPAWVAALEWSRPAIAEGELWRLLTACFVHAGWPHFAANLLGFLLLRACLGSLISTTTVCWRLPLFTSLCTGLGMYWLPAPGAYLGFSSVLHGMAAYGGWRWSRGEPERCVMVLGLLLMKLAADRHGLSVMSSGEAFPVAPDAHAWGAFAGSLLAWRDARSRSNETKE